jgi:AraC family transcriptional regulator
MTTRLRQVQPVLAFSAAHLDEDLSLEALAEQAGLSVFHLHRVFSAAAGETPKRFTLRLRLGRAAAMLLAGGDSMLDVALACGFESHAVFCRAFRRRFGMTPSTYRERGFLERVGAVQARQHAALVDRVGRCIGLYHIREDGRSSRQEIPRKDMTYSITRKKLTPQPVLVLRRQIQPSGIAQALAEMFQQVFEDAQRNGVALAGPPFARYLEMGRGLWTIEAGMPVAGPSADTLPGGLAAMTTHAGPYDQLPEAHAAIQQWIAAEGLAAAGAPWESYVTDPADYPDPKDWKTEVYFPLVGPLTGPLAAPLA